VHLGATGEIRTHGVRVLQTLALGLSATVALFGYGGGIRTPNIQFWRLSFCQLELRRNENLVLPLGFEPRSSPHLEASPRYKLGALPLSYGSKNLERVERIELSHYPWQGQRLPLHHTRNGLSSYLGSRTFSLELYNTTAFN
jgi:hypothetical protein